MGCLASLGQCFTASNNHKVSPNTPKSSRPHAGLDASTLKQNQHAVGQKNAATSSLHKSSMNDSDPAESAVPTTGVLCSSSSEASSSTGIAPPPDPATAHSALTLQHFDRPGCSSASVAAAEPVDPHLCLQALSIVIHVCGRNCWPLPLCCTALHAALPALSKAHIPHLRSPATQAHLTRLTRLNTLVLKQRSPLHSFFCVIDTPVLIRNMQSLTQLRHLCLHCDNISPALFREGLSPLGMLTHLELATSNIMRPPPDVLTSSRKWKLMLSDKLSWLAYSLENRASGTPGDACHDALEYALRQLKRLRHLEISRSVGVRCCMSNEAWRDCLQDLTSLSHLALPYLPCGYETWLPGLKKLVALSAALEPYRFSSASAWLDPAHLTACTQLTSLQLDVEGEHMAKNLGQWLPRLTTLRHLDTVKRPLRSVSMLSSLTQLTHLHTITWAGNSDSSCVSLLGSLSLLRHLSVRFEEQCDHAASVLTQLTLLTSLSLQYCSRFAVSQHEDPAASQATATTTTTANAWFPHLKQLELDHCNLNDCAALFASTLTHLSVKFPRSWSQSCSEALHPLVNMQELTLLDCTHFNTTLQHLTTMSKLMQLHYQVSDPDEGDYEFGPLGQLTSLTSLHLLMDHSLSHSALLLLTCLSNLTQLQHLGLQVHVKFGLTRHADWLLPELLPALRQLRVLELGDCMLTSACEKVLSHLTNLELCRIWMQKRSPLRPQAVSTLLALPSSPGVTAGRLRPDDLYFCK